jgi:hypothetical protein
MEDTTDKRKHLNITEVEAVVGVHQGCGGDLALKFDNPFGTVRCKKCGITVKCNNLKFPSIKKGEKL